jgi:hypothetical protein
MFITAGISAMAPAEKYAIMERVRTFSEFSPENDPYGEHDFGSFDFAGTKIFWKIDCYDLAMQHGSPNPADPAVTSRVITVLLADEY